MQPSCNQRAEAIPDDIHYPPELPISGKAAEIAALVKTSQVLVVAGDTGSGKTTQLPKICLQAGLGRRGMIGHTQPRRLAAVSVANRIAEELGCETGQGVGYQVRFNDKQGPQTYLKVMTDGILLAEIARDRFLNRYEVLIIDEAHERSLNIDFLLGFLKRLLAKRKDLKVIITSATIDVEKFALHFDNAPIVKVSGRTYPVEVRYAPIDNEDGEAGSVDAQVQAISESVQDILTRPYKQDPGGDILVFLSGEREIREAAQVLRKLQIPALEILPLYARLRHAEQTKIFNPPSSRGSGRGRRVVLATNVAETSITVPGINYVIDTGLARISRYSLQSKVQRLPIEPVSQASANQRKGRCGRLAGGICIRLYSEEDFAARPLYTDPEIKRTNLASVILRMKHLRLGEPEDFPFLEPPESKAINEGMKLLSELNALDVRRQLTEAGKKMALLPVDPRYGRMIVTAATESCLREVLIITSALSIQDPREINADNRAQAQDKLARFQHPESDFLTLVNLWHEYENKRQQLSQSQLRKFCKSHFLSFMRMREWREVHRQLLLACQGLGLRTNKADASYEQIHRSIISGSLNQIACRQEGREYLNIRNRRFTLFPASVLADKQCQWIVTGELIETARTFAALAARIKPQWVEQMALHLVKREYYQPHWSSKRQEVRAYEKVHLYGLTLIEKASVGYAGIDPVESREIFIREALVGGEIQTRADFFSRNARLLRELGKEEEKMRRPDSIIGERDIYRFYEERLPADIHSTRSLEKWLRQTGRENDSLLMDRQSLLGDDGGTADQHAYPDHAPVRQNRLAIDYVFDPGSVKDGASIAVPLAILNQLTQSDIDWAVPGILRDKCIALLKSLPKAQRKKFIPISGFVDTVLPQMSSKDGDLIDALLAQIQNRKRLKFTRADFADTELPSYLQSKIKVLDVNGNELGIGHNVKELQGRFAEASESTQLPSPVPGYGHELEQAGLTDWTFGELPEEVRLGDDLVLIRYPALVDEQDSVRIQLFADRQAASAANRQGLIRLFMLRSVQQRNLLRKQFRRLVNEQALIMPAWLGSLPEQAVLACYAKAFAVDEQAPRSAGQFSSLLDAGKGRLHSVASHLEDILRTVLKTHWAIRSQLASLPKELEYLRVDIDGQLNYLLAENFLLETPYSWLTEYPRFLEATRQRLAKVPHMGPRDEPCTKELEQYWQRFRELADAAGSEDSDTMGYLRWLLEEYRVSLFAQTLGTSVTVSTKRLDQQFSKLGCYANEH